jgi:hypothetical protein
VTLNQLERETSVDGSVCYHYASLVGIVQERLKSFSNWVFPCRLTSIEWDVMLRRHPALRERSAMRLARLRGTCPDTESCPTLFWTDRNTAVVQGVVVTRPEALGTRALSAGEAAVEVPDCPA